GRRASPPVNPGWPGAKLTVSSCLCAIARMAAPVTRRNSSSRLSREVISLHQRSAAAALLQVGPEAALVVLRHRRPLELIALVEEGQAESEGDVVEYPGIVGPGHHRARRHHGGDVAVDEAGAGKVRQPHHRIDGLAPRLVV